VKAVRLIGAHIAQRLFIIVGGPLDGHIRHKSQLPAGIPVDPLGFYGVSVEYIQIGREPLPHPVLPVGGYAIGVGRQASNKQAT